MSSMLSDIPHIPRLDFTRRLEPSGDVVLHGAGQSPEAFKEYFEALGDHKPLLYMSYVMLKDEMPSISSGSKSSWTSTCLTS